LGRAEIKFVRRQGISDRNEILTRGVRFACSGAAACKILFAEYEIFMARNCSALRLASGKGTPSKTI
jgi:hypothetical protein